jgi:hypothetical protein
MNLNLNEQLLCDIKDANICIFIANLASWLRLNIDKEKFAHRNVREGKCWSYSTIKDYQNYFNFWSIRNLRTIIKNCQEKGLIEIGNFNKKKYDKTCWYTLTDKALEYYPILRDKIKSRIHETSKTVENTDLSEVTNGFVRSDNAIPEKHNSLRSNINITTSGNNKISAEEVVDAYHSTLPDSPKIRVIGNDLLKQIRSMIKNWPKYQKEGKPFSIDSFVDYLLYIKKHYAWFLKPYTTESGKIKRNNLTNITREKNIVRIVNGEFSAN